MHHPPVHSLPSAKIICTYKTSITEQHLVIYIVAKIFSVARCLYCNLRETYDLATLLLIKSPAVQVGGGGGGDMLFQFSLIITVCCCTVLQLDDLKD